MDDAPATAGTESSPASRSRVSGPPRIHVEIPTSSLSEGDNYQPGSDRYAISPMDQPSHGSEGLQSTANSPHQSESEPRSVSSVRGRGEGESIEGPSVTTNHRTSPNTGNGGRYDVPKENQNPDEGHARLAELWIPWSLRCRFLISNCLLFAVFIVVLEVLYSISQRHNGLASSEEKLYYLWTYGPTAILTIIAALWGQVEYQAKQLLPWNNLRAGPSRAADSVLLDYISPWVPNTLYSALKSLHHAVYAAVSGSILIKIIIVASTGLVTLQEETLTTSNAKFKLADRFSGNMLAWVDSRAAAAAVGIQLLDLAYIPGTSDSYAVQSFTSSSPPKDQNYILGATVDAFSADLDCETLVVTNHSQSFGDDGDVRNLCPVEVFTFTKPVCDGGATSASFDYRMWQIYKNQSGSLFQVNCPATLSEPNANRLLFITSDTQLLGNSTAVFTALSCNPTYSIDRAFVNINQSGVLTNTTIDPSNSPSTGRSANFSAWDVTMAVIKSADLASLGAASSQITTTSNRPPEMYCSEVWQDTNSTTLLSLAISAVPGLDITNAPMLQAAVQRSYRIIAAQIAKQNLMLPADETIPGTQTFTTQRIFIRQLSLRIMEVAFSILIIVTLIVVVSRPCRSTPEDMSTIGRLAIVMAQSPSFVKIMRGLGSTNIKRIGSWLSGQNFRTVIAEGGSIPSRFSIEPLGEDSSSAERTREREEEKIDWWRPLPIRLIPRLGTLLVTALIVVALEVLLYFSRRDNGLAVVNTSNYDHYAWTYIPGVVMSSLHLLYGVIDFSTRVVQPYVQLKKRPSTAGKTIFVNYLSHLTVIAAWKSILNKHFMVLSTAVTMLLAPFLTIVASGLFTAAAVPYHKTAIVTRGNTLNTSLQGRYSAVDSTMTGNITLTNSLIIGSNMSYPTWTHDGLVFPSLSARIAETSAFAGNDTMNATALTTRVPALYTSLNCTQLNIEQVHLFTSVADTILFREITLPVPSDCGIKCIPHASENMCTDGSYDFAQTHLNGQHRPINGSFFGKVFEAVPFSPPTRPDCPRLLAVYGRNSHDSSNIEDMVALSCSPFTSQVQVDATFSLPDWTAVATTVDPTTQSKVGMDALYPFHDYLPAKNVSGYDYDPAFAALAYGRDSIPVHQLLGPENAPKVMDALERLYARWAAQALNIIARVPAPPDAATLDGMLVFENQMRLQQSVISTRILEVLLLLMFLCVVITLFQIDTKRLLPNNPCSIGATAALIAESEMVNADNSPGPGVEWYSEKKLKGIGLYEGSRFSLDWWDRGEGEERRYGIDVRDVGPVP